MERIYQILVKIWLSICYSIILLGRSFASLSVSLWTKKSKNLTEFQNTSQCSRSAQPSNLVEFTVAVYEFARLTLKLIAYNA